MKNKASILKNLILVISIYIYCYSVFYGRNQYIYNMSYIKCILFMLLISLFVYTYGIVINEQTTYKSNIIIYICLYSILLITVTFFIGRVGISFYKWWYAGQYKPFHMIVSQINYGSNISILKNIVGNCVMLVPLSFLLMIKNKNYSNIFRQSIVILPAIISIELLQAFTHTGAFDIDDIILNYAGTIVFTFLITRFNLIDRIRNLFYTDYKLSDRIKQIIFCISSIVLFAFDIILLIR